MGRRLDPTVNMWQLAQPLIEEWMRNQRGPEARIADLLADGADAALRLPRTLSRIERMIEENELLEATSIKKTEQKQGRLVFWFFVLLAIAGWSEIFFG